MIHLCLAFLLLLVLAISFIYLAAYQQQWAWQRTSCMSLLVCILSLTLYAKWGASAEWLATERQALLQKTWQQQLQNPSAIVKRLEQHLKSYPNSAQGWFLLGKLYSSQQRFAEAGFAYTKAAAIKPLDQAIVWQVVQADYLAKQTLSPANRLKLNALLAKQPQFLPALNLLALDAFQHGHFALAQSLWQQLLRQVPENSDEAKMLWLAIGKAQQHLPRQKNLRSLTVKISLAPFLIAQLKPTDTLWVVARAADLNPLLSNRSSAIPVAITRLKASKFPLLIKLDNGMAMLPNYSLANVQKVTIVARISHSGMATRNIGDLEGVSGVYDLSKPLSILPLTIDQTVHK